MKLWHVLLVGAAVSAATTGAWLIVDDAIRSETRGGDPDKVPRERCYAEGGRWVGGERALCVFGLPRTRQGPGAGIRVRNDSDAPICSVDINGVVVPIDGNYILPGDYDVFPLRPGSFHVEAFYCGHDGDEVLLWSTDVTLKKGDVGDLRVISIGRKQ